VSLYNRVVHRQCSVNVSVWRAITAQMMHQCMRLDVQVSVTDVLCRASCDFRNHCARDSDSCATPTILLTLLCYRCDFISRSRVYQSRHYKSALTLLVQQCMNGKCCVLLATELPRRDTSAKTAVITTANACSSAQHGGLSVSMTAATADTAATAVHSHSCSC
jgi:hypothetical protein